MGIDLSVITATYNKSSQLINYFVSLGAQTFDHSRFEIIIVDDGSNDATLPVVREARKVFDYKIRYFYLDRPGVHTACLPHNFAIRKAEADILVHWGPDIIGAKDVLELHYSYQQLADHLYTFSNCYNIHSPMAQHLLSTVNWQEDFRQLESLFISPYHHAASWSVPFLASIHKKHFVALRGYDESYEGHVWADDSDMICRLWASGIETFNATDVWSAHQFHGIQQDPQCPPENCPCPLHSKDLTSPGKDMKYNGKPEDLIRNLDHWGEFQDAEEM